MRAVAAVIPSAAVAPGALAEARDRSSIEIKVEHAGGYPDCVQTSAPSSRSHH